MDTNNDPRRLDVSVIVPVWNGAKTLGTCLRALCGQTFDPAQFEIIVVDDGSHDGSADIAVRFGASVQRQEHAGAAAARNLGAQHARGELLLFTDTDCEPFSDWIDQMVQPFSSPQVAGAKGVYRTHQHALVARFTQAEYEEKYAHMRSQASIDFVDTYSAAYRKQVFLEHSGFDPTFLLDEDQELSFRLSQAGHRLVFLPEARVYHRHPTNAWCYARRKVGMGRWKVRVLSRYPRKAIRDSYTPWTQKAQIVLLPLSLAGVAAAIGGWVPWSLVQFLLALGLISALPLMGWAGRQSIWVFACSPVMIALRTLALDTGLILGSLELLGSKKGKKTESRKGERDV